jgi:TolA-binding protein
MSHKASDDTQLDPTAERVAEFLSAHAGPPAPAKLGEKAFLRRLANFRRVQRHRKRFTVGIAVTLSLVVVGLAGSRFRNDAPAVNLSYRVDNREPPSGGYILVSQTEESLLAFSDGSKVRMAARARGRVVELNNRGARFALEDGKASVDIVPRPRAQWTFEAGPFLVRVHGTSFTVAWNPADAVFDVRLRNGAISVVSPIAGPEIQLRAGQTLRVSLREQTSTTGTMGTSDTSTAPAGAPVAAAPPSFEPPTTMPPGLSAPARWSHRGWTAALAENKAADVVADADRRGVTAVLERADSEDLWALANAARYAGRYPLARQALTAHRRRFPSSDRARDAAFLLGRLHDGDRHGPGDALGWYDRYLVEARDGVHVSDALGRKMTLLQRWNRRTEALAVAHDYLRRFPHGTYANAARALVRASER